ncbi:MAG: hypothetical protein KGL12_05015, partial [Rhodospirillales bacterium]|nr:hypothetical protein [Rhodospirillales bacterium]
MTDTDPPSPTPMQPDTTHQDPPPPAAAPAASATPRLPEADGARAGGTKPASAAATPQAGAAKRSDPARRTAHPVARRGLAVALILLGFIALAGAGTWAWMHPHATALPGTASSGAASSGAASSGAASSGTEASGTASSGTESSGAGPEDRAALHALSTRISRLEQAPHPAAAPTAADMAALAARLDALATQEKALATQQDGGNAALASRLDAIETGLAALRQTMAQTAQQAAAAASAARLSEAAAALALGAPLGVIPHAPAALSRYAGTAPPT